VIAVAKPNLSNAESQELEELRTKYGDIFAMESDDYRRPDEVYHCIDTGEGRPIRQPPRRLHLTKQVNVGEILEDMQRSGVIEVRQPLVIPVHSHPEEQGPSILCRLQ
jgi:hypothetical protein